MTSLTPLTDSELQLWSSYIKTTCGNNLDNTKAYLIENRLGSLAQETGSKSWMDLYSKAKADLSGSIRKKIISAITTNETSFFRDMAPFELLQHKILPDLIDSRKKTTSPGHDISLRIWSAASSTGQEIYSAAITIRELLGNLKGYDVRLVGTDISDKVIAQASYAKYNKFEIERGLPQEKLNRYFEPEGNLWKVRDEVRAMATFKTINLLEPFTFPHKFDIIFCRNVAIYFTEDDRRKMFNRIGEYLAADGYLLIGSTESLSGLCPQFKSFRYVRSVYYQIEK
jgi:chemotaxis protein methyltransferase CheR